MRDAILRHSIVAIILMWLIAGVLETTADGDFAPGRIIALLLVVLSVPIGLMAGATWFVGIVKREKASTDLDLDK